MACRPPFDLVLFDCDSTLSTIEGIDELARQAGVDAEVAELTRSAMEGRVPLEAVYGRRLELIQPDREAIKWLGSRYLESEVIGAQEVMSALQTLGKDVHVVSAGIRNAVRALAQRLGVPRSRVHAVDLIFDVAGRYRGFDERSPLTRAGGKAEICRQLGAESRVAALVGDGITDLEVAAAGVFVIGFGGVVAREVMRERADCFVPGPSLAAVLDPLLSAEERARIAPMAVPQK